MVWLASPPASWSVQQVHLLQLQTTEQHTQPHTIVEVSFSYMYVALSALCFQYIHYKYLVMYLVVNSVEWTISLPPSLSLSLSPHLCLDASLVVIDHYDTDKPAAVWSRTGSQEELLVRLLLTLCLVLPPAGQVVGYGAILITLKTHMSTIVWGGGGRGGKCQ